MCFPLSAYGESPFYTISSPAVLFFEKDKSVRIEFEWVGVNMGSLFVDMFCHHVVLWDDFVVAGRALKGGELGNTRALLAGAEVE